MKALKNVKILNLTNNKSNANNSTEMPYFIYYIGNEQKNNISC